MEKGVSQDSLILIHSTGQGLNPSLTLSFYLRPPLSICGVLSLLIRCCWWWSGPAWLSGVSGHHGGCGGAIYQSSVQAWQSQRQHVILTVSLVQIVCC